MRREALAVLSMVLLAAVAGAQEDVRGNEPAAEDQEIAPENRQKIQVLEHPYDIASFYRSAEGGYFWAPAYPVGPGYGYGDPSHDRYPIAGFYRQRGGYYSQFWTGGYGGWGGYGGGGVGHQGNLGRGGRGPVRPGLGGGRGRGFGRSIGENGDLFLMAPAFLAPVGPLSGVFFSDPAK
jgi:hypothetical protein